jgi:CheY-like chemotaxis protein
MRALKKKKVIQHVVHVNDGASAIDFLFGKGEFDKRNVNIQPKIILLDLKMPRFDGMDVLAQIKTDDLTKKIPVIVLTSSKESPDIKKAYALGANSYIVKPVEFEGFAKAITDIGLYWLFLNQNHER